MMRDAIRALMQIRPGEGRAVGFAFAYFFMLMGGYYLLRPLRDAMASGVVESLFSFYVGTFTVMLLLTPLFGALVSRVRKPMLLPIAYLFFASNLLVFYLLFKATPDSRALAASFFVWVSVYNMFVVSCSGASWRTCSAARKPSACSDRSPPAAAPERSSGRW